MADMNKRPAMFQGKTDEELMELYKQERAARTMTAPEQPQGVEAMLGQFGQRTGQPSLSQNIGDFITRLGGGEPSKASTTANPYELALFKENLQRSRPKPDASNLPEGFVVAGDKVVQDPSYIDPFEQSKIDASESEEATAIKAQEDAQKAVRTRAERNLATVEDIKAGKEFFGPYGDMPSIVTSLGGLRGNHYGKRSDWEANLDRLRSELTFEKIQELKNASETGATGLGPVSEVEFKALMDSATALRRNLGPEEAAKHIKIIEDTYRKILGQDVGNQAPERGEFFGDGGANVPPGAAYHSKTTGKYYDEEGNEL